MGEVGGHILETVGEEMMQVWSETQFCSVDFSKSRIGVKKVRFQQTHNQCLHQLFLAVSWDLRT